MQFKLICTICTWLCLISSSTFTFAQSIEECLQVGDRMRSLNKDHLALKQYRRAYFFYSKSKTQSDSLELRLLSSLSNAAYNSGNKAESFQYLDVAISISEGENRNGFVLTKTDRLIQALQFNKALIELYQYQPMNKTDSNKHHLLLGIAYFGNSSYNKAETAWLALAQTQDDSLLITEKFQKVKRKLDPRRPGRARHYSLIIPGLGQMLAGDVKNSLNSAVLVLGITALYVYSIQEYGPINAIIGILPWFSRYHVGGGENAMRSMQKRQRLLKDRYFNEFMSLLAG